MKSFKSCLLAGVAGLMVLMSSCLGNGSNSYSNPYIGVIGFSTNAGRMVLQAEGVDIYFPGVEDATKYPEGSCWAMSIKINMDEQTSNKYMIGALESGGVQFDYNRNVMSLTDGEIKLEENEKPIEGLAAAFYGGNIVTKNRVFVESRHQNKTNQLNTLKLYIDPNQEPEKYSENGAEYNMYTVYVRSICINEGDSTSSSKAESKLTAFDLGYIGESWKEKEKSNKKSIFVVQVKYIKSIKEDGTFEVSQSSESVKMGYNTFYTPETTN